MVNGVQARVGGRKVELHPTVKGKTYLGWQLVLRSEETKAFKALIYAGSEGIRCERKHGVAYGVTA